MIWFLNVDVIIWPIKLNAGILPTLFVKEDVLIYVLPDCARVIFLNTNSVPSNHLLKIHHFPSSFLVFIAYYFLFPFLLTHAFVNFNVYIHVDKSYIWACFQTMYVTIKVTLLSKSNMYTVLFVFFYDLLKDKGGDHALCKFHK